MQLLLSFLSIGCAGIPMFAFLGVIWWLDRYDREPVWLLVITFLWGATGAVTLSVIVSLILRGLYQPLLLLVGGPDLDPALAQAAEPVLLAPFVEEPAKALILLFVMWNRHFDNMTDGFVYGAAAGLGFGMTENLLYFFTVSDDAVVWGSTVLIRTFYSAVMHATASAIVGAALGFARFRGVPAMLGTGAVGMALAMLVHAVWNGLITMSGLTGGQGFFTADLILLPVEVVAVFLVFQICLVEESAVIERELTEEASAGRLPPEHPGIIASWTRRLSTRWVPRGVDRERYVQVATSLAMRKKQVRQMGSRSPAFYVDEVTRLRGELGTLLRRT